jgi:RNA polymerase sigma-70 factor (ECF subfamily)
MWRPKKGPEDQPSDVVTQELVDRCRSGDEIAWRDLVEATHRDVYSLCLRILGDPDDAAEATQDAYLKAWRGLKGFRGDSMFSTWLYRVATNAALSKHRSRKRRREHESGADDEVMSQIPSGASTEAAAGAKIDVESLDRALGELPEHYRMAVVLKDVYGLSIEEIAKQMKCSETAAKVRIHRARKKLKEMVFPEGTPE